MFAARVQHTLRPEAMANENRARFDADLMRWSDYLARQPGLDSLTVLLDGDGLLQVSVLLLGRDDVERAWQEQAEGAAKLVVQVPHQVQVGHGDGVDRAPGAGGGVHGGARASHPGVAARGPGADAAPLQQRIVHVEAEAGMNVTRT